MINEMNYTEHVRRYHMEDEGWIPVEEKLPEPGEIVLVNQLYSWEHYEEGAMVTVGRLRELAAGGTT